MTRLSPPPPRAAFAVLDADGDWLLLRDDGHDHQTTITNDAEGVVAWLASTATLAGRRLVYLDSQGELAELRHDGARFRGFGYPGLGELPTWLRGYV